ncbi:spore cortex biosynthesis protein YabQ [Microbacteriaceae bacterium 4G12]
MSLTVQFYTMLSMIGMGAWLGAALDTYQRFLHRSRRKRWIVFIHDILFWMLQSLLIFYVLLLINEAELGLYVFLALLCGFAAYQSLLKSMYTKTLEYIIQITIQTYRFLFSLVKNLIVRPILYIFQLLIAVVLFLIQLLKTILLWTYKVLIRLLGVIWKILFVPVRFLGVIVWKLLPNRVKIFVKRYAGIVKRIENVKVTILKWWRLIRKRLGGPRK